MYLNLRTLFSIACHVKRLKILPRPRPYCLRHVPPSHATVSWVIPSPNFPFYCSRRGCFLLSPANFPFAGAKLLLPALPSTSCFWTRVLLPCVIPYTTASPFLQHFPPPAPAGSVFFCDLIRRQFAASRSSIWVWIASSSNRGFFACRLHLDLAGSVLAFFLVEVFSLRCSGGSSTRWLVREFLCGLSSHSSVKSLPYLLHCCRKFFLLRRSSRLSDCRIELVNIFTSHFDFWKNLLPVPFRHCFDLISFRYRSGVGPFYLQLFHFIVALDVHSLISINRSLRFSILISPFRTSSVIHPSGALPPLDRNSSSFSYSLPKIHRKFPLFCRIYTNFHEISSHLNIFTIS